MKGNKGITLVALIITIIVMMILVAVTVSIVINSDLLGTAKSAGENWEGKQTSEGNLGKGDVTINNQTWDEYMQSMCSHTYGEWEITTEATYSAAGEKERTCTKCNFVQTQAIPKLECTEHTFVNNVCSNCGKVRIEFTISGETFYAYENMTWGDYVEATEINTYGFYLNYDFVMKRVDELGASMYVRDGTKGDWAEAGDPIESTRTYIWG